MLVIYCEICGKVMQLLELNVGGVGICHDGDGMDTEYSTRERQIRYVPLLRKMRNYTASFRRISRCVRVMMLLL